MVDAGCDVIEVGLPYSDPVMDGPTIQAAAQQALEGGVRTRDVLRTVEAVAATGHPDGRDDLLEPGRPLRRRPLRPGPRLRRRSRADHARPDPRQRRGVDRGRRRATTSTRSSWSRPSSTDARIAMTTAACRGFVYATAVMGVTGARTSTSDLAGPLVARTRGATDLPGRGRPRRQQRRPGRRGGVVRRRRDRRLGVRPGAARPPRRPAGRAARPRGADRGPGRGSPACLTCSDGRWSGRSRPPCWPAAAAVRPRRATSTARS